MNKGGGFTTLVAVTSRQPLEQLSTGSGNRVKMNATKRILSQIPRFGPGLAAAVLAGGCGTESLAPATIAIAPEIVALTDTEPGATEALLAVIQDKNGRALHDVQVNWSITDSSVATVVGAGQSGSITVVGNGSTVVSASVGTLDAQATVTVRMSNRWVLLEVYNALGGDEWVSNTNWGSDQPLDTWHGVTTDSRGDVVELSMGSNGVSGSLPAEIGMLGSLEVLRLTREKLTGPIPPELGNLTNLRVLWLRSNDLTGPIPPELGNLSGLNWLDLGENRLEGAIPPELGDLTELSGLRLEGNRLEGAIPPELGDLASLQDLHLGSNDLTGPIPSELGNLTELRALFLRGNRLEGTIPPGLGNLPKIGILSLDWNDLTGPIPPEFGNFESLRGLNVSHTSLSGRLPRELIGVSLNSFFWNETDLCSPADGEFQQWLMSIRRHMENRKCSS